MRSHGKSAAERGRRAKNMVHYYVRVHRLRAGERGENSCRNFNLQPTLQAENVPQPSLAAPRLSGLCF